ncbi:MAG: T9SS type A sorting domain-containing protein [Sphingobacteriaceae bacterium]|nr:T9SS type A sorting domain-containing protein [Cytophagaceae bacterium]
MLFLYRKPLLRGLYLAVLCLTTTGIFAQISITFPTNRVIFQRNNSNQATFTVAGYFTQAIDKVEVRLLVQKGGTALNWTTLQTNPQGGVFGGTVTASGGWYSLEVRGTYQNNQVGNVATLERVGVGEVFVIAGQSNAQGGFNAGDMVEDAIDDRVNCVSNYFNENFSPNEPPAPVYSKITASSTLAPYGKSAWCWAPLGDKLAARLGVPILFINAGFEGTNISNWRESAEGLRTEDMYKKPNLLPEGVPYVNLRVALNYYVPILGMRAVLWHQGEADGLRNQAYEYHHSESSPAVSSLQYRNDLGRIIDRSREHSGKNLSWVIARASLYRSCLENGVLTNRNSPEVLQGQELVINNISNVFRGPYTDTVQAPRPSECVHFGNTPTQKGHQMHANAWEKSLDAQFFSASTPQSPTAPPLITVGCPTAARTLSLPGGFALYRWASGQTTPSISATAAGSYSAKVKDFVGNFLPAPTVVFAQEASVSGVTVQINASGATCGGTLTLSTTIAGGSGTYTYAWSGPNGFSSTQASPTVPNLSAVNSGTYAVTLSQSGCTLASAQRAVEFTCGGAGGGGSGGACVVTKIRLYPRASLANRLAGGRIQGANNPGGPWQDVFTVPGNASSTWNEFSFANTTPYAYVRYLTPEYGYCNLAEVEFYNGSTRLTGRTFADASGPWSGETGRSFEKAFDGNVNTFYDANDCCASYVALQLDACGGGGACTPPAAPQLSASVASVCPGGGVTLTASGCGGTVSWTTGATGSTLAVGAGTYSATCTQGGCTSAASPSLNIATSSDCGGGSGGACVVTRIRFYARPGTAIRVPGGRIQGTNNPAGPWQTLFTIPSATNDTWHEFSFANTTVYAYVRYLTPQGGHCNIAELEFYNGNTRLRGRTFADASGPLGGDRTFEKAFDGNVQTFYDANDCCASYVGLQLDACTQAQARLAVEFEELREIGFGVSVAPNPSASVFKVEIQLPTASVIRLGVYDLLGREVRQAEVRGQAGENQIPIQLGGHPDGLYLLRVQVADQPVVTRKLLKRNN